MKVSAVRKLSNENRFWYWIKERESIRKLRAKKVPKPWTDDEILQTYRFCNVRRMDDKVSLWLYNNWYTPYFDHKYMVPAITMARHFNLPDSLAVLGFPKRWEPERFKSKLRYYRDEGNKIFNSAYMVRGNNAIDKIEAVITHVTQPMIDNPPQLNTNSMEESVKIIKPYYGLGSFMAGQIVADLRWAISGKWKDAKTWAAIGPGSQRGMNRLMQRDIRNPIPQSQFNEELAYIMKEGKKAVPPSVTKLLEAIDWQNCLCEYDKYCRPLVESRRLKQLFRSEK